MKAIANAVASILAILLIAGCTAPERLSEEEILAKAKAEIARLGVALPDETGTEGLAAVGATPKVAASGDGWEVKYPVDHPWAIGWIYLEMDSRGKVLRHRIQPGH